MKTLLACLLLTVSICAQDQPQPDRWRGLVLDESTPAQAIATLGQPKEDKTDRLRVFEVPGKWLSKRHEEKTFRLLTWEKLDGMNKVEAGFDGERLVLLALFPKEQPAAAALTGIYGMPLTPRVGVYETAFPADFERNQGRVYPRTYPSAFALVGVASRVFVGALVMNAGLGSILRNSAGVSDGDIPGKVKRIEFVSRALENRDGAAALK